MTENKENEKLNCGECGASLFPKMDFCRQCGAVIDDSSKNKKNKSDTEKKKTG